MLESLHIKNFQAHRDLRIDFDEHVTTIVGENDKGKSAIVRALFWLAFNRPSGNEFISWGKKGTAVKLEVDGQKIVRRKGQTNTYSLNGNQFKAFGQDVPKEVADLINLDYVNFQNQHDAPFWFSLTPGQVSRELNRIVDLSVVDRAQSLVSADLRKAVVVETEAGRRMSAAKETVDNLAWVKTAQEDLAGLEGLETRLDLNRHQIACITSLFQDGTKYLSDRDLAVQAALGGEKLLETGQKAIDLAESRVQLQDLVDQAVDCQESVDRGTPSLDDLNRVVDKLTKIMDRLTQLKSLVDAAAGLIKVKRELEVEYRSAAEAHRELMGSECPLCMRPLST